LTAPFLFSVDLEDVRHRIPDGDRYRPRVAAMTGLYLDFLRRNDATGTFFVVGDVARAEPDLVRRIAGEGHEIACHSDSHVPLDRQDERSFREDVERNLEALAAAGAKAVRGYRAPCFSLTARTRWAYGVLAGLGIEYSSSVLPARNPLHGCPEFGTRPRMMDGIVELPMTLLPWRLLPVPVGGGVYFRTVPRFLLRRALRRRRERGEAVLGYFHPYDVDGEQEEFAHPGFRRGGLFDRLMRVNRTGTFARLEEVKRLGFSFGPYGEHAERIRSELQVVDPP
jgi:polysaccharide deacetylase family protein (PEP-CTERM system associated)